MRIADKPLLTMKFKVVVDELNYNGPLIEPQYFEVSGLDEEICWNMAENEANARCFAFGKIREYTIMLVVRNGVSI